MIGDLRKVLVECWESDTTLKKNGSTKFCRWCRFEKPGEHDPDCPCVALDLALQHREALVKYFQAFKRNLTLQGATRLARKSDKDKMKKRLEDSVLLLESARARIHELGIEEYIR